MLQVYKRMFQGMFTMAFGEGATAGEINDSQDMGALISQNKEPIANYLNSLDIRDQTGGTGSDGQLRFGDVFRQEDQTAVDKILKAVGLDQYSLAAGVPISEVVAKLDAFSGKSSQVKKDSKVKRAKSEVRGNNPEYARTSDFVMQESTGDIATGETQRENKHKVLGINTGSTEVNLENADKHANLGSLTQILSIHDAGTILAEINANRVGDTFTDYGLWKDADIMAVQNALVSRGYDARGRIGDKEAAMISSLLSGIVKSQGEVKKLTGMQKIHRLLDVNQDGKLNAFTNAKYGEAQALSVLEWMTEVQRSVNTEAQFNTLLRTIGLNPTTFNQNLDSNFFVTRLNFAEALKTNWNVMPSLSSLVGGKTNEFTKSQLELQDKNLGQVEQLLLANASVKEVMDALDPSLRQAELTRMAKDVVDFEGGGMLFTPHGIATAVSARIANDYHASIGTIEGDSIFVSLERSVYSSAKTNVNLGVGTDFKKICLYASGSQVLRSGFDEKTVKNWSKDELFTGKVAVSAHAVVTLSGLSGIGLNFDKSKSAAIANQVASVKSGLTAVGELFLTSQNPTFDKLGLTGDAADMQKNMKVFDMMLNRFNNDTAGLSPEQKELYVKSMVAGYVQYVENNLYFQNEGVSFSGGGIGILAGHPVAFLGLEDINAKWNHNDVNNSATAATYEATRERGFTEREIGGEKGQVGPHKTLSFRGMVKGNVSAKAGSGVEVQELDGALHVSGNITSIDLVRYISPTNEKADILVINGGNVNGTEMVPGGYAIGITKSIPQNGTERYITGQQAVTEQVSIPLTETTVGISEPILNAHLAGVRQHIDANISVRDLYTVDKNDKIDSETILAKFQRDVFKAGRELTSEQVNDFFKDLTTGKLGKFMQKRVGTLTANSVDDKRFIINSVMLALRNDNSTNADLDFSNSTSTLTNGRTLREYYNESMETNMISNIANSRKISTTGIKSAYDTLMGRIGHQNSFTTQVGSSDVLSSSAASQYLKGKNGVQFGIRGGVVDLSEGVHETIGEYVPVSLTSQERNTMIDNLPNRFLQRKVDTINASLYGGQITIDQLRTAMKNNTSIEGTSITPTYYTQLTLTGNCLNLQLDEGISLSKVVTEGGGTTTVNRGFVNTYGERTVSNIQYGKASMDGYQQAEFDVNKYIVGVVVDTNKDKDGLATQGTDGDDLSTQGTGGDGVGSGGDLTNGGELGSSTPIVTDGGPIGQSTATPKMHDITSADATKYIHRNIDNRND